MASDTGIFNGLRFFLVQRLPTRSHWIDLIKKHGGTVVPLDKRADIVIADHARQDSPPDSITWRFILECDKEGRLLNKEPFRIGRLSSQQPRPTASREAPRQSRVPYTNEDDCILTAWVTSRDNPGGNKIYQELEAAFPRHTWQSWRDRWVKKLRNLPQYIHDDMASRAPPLESPASPPPVPNEPHPLPQAKARPLAARPQPSRTSNSVQREGREEQERPPGFTEAEDELLVEHVKVKVLAGNMWKRMAIYEEFAKEYPRHSAVAWKDRFTLMWRNKEFDMEDWIPSRSRSGRPEIQPFVSDDDDFTPQPRRQSSPTEPRHSPPESILCKPSERSPSEPLSNKDRFYGDLEVVAATFNKDDAGEPQLERWERISGHDIEMWDLYQSVVRQDCPIDEVEWHLVAQDLELEWIEHEDLGEKLRECWNERLDKYHEYVGTGDFLNDVDDAEEEAVDDHYDAGAVEEEMEAVRDEVVEDEEEGLYEQESPQLRRGNLQSNSLSPSLSQDTPEREKRRREPSLLLTGSPMRKRKRKRIERSVEIPATPEWGQQPGGESSRSKKRGQRPNPPRADDVAADLDADDEERVPSSGAPSSRAPARREEPEARRMLRPRAAPETAARRSKTKPSSSPANSAPAPRRTLPPAFESRRRTSPSGPSTHDDDDHGHGAEATRREKKSAPSSSVMSAISILREQGYTANVIEEALYRAAQAPDKAPAVMECLKRGRGVPEGIRGVWTPADDKALRMADAARRGEGSGGDAEERRRRRKEAAGRMDALLKKHGWEIVEDRRDFLAEAAGESPWFSD